MPGRSKRMRYVYADESHRLARSQQPVYAWKRSWVTPAQASGDEAESPYKIFKWIKTGQTVIHEDEEDDVSQDAQSVPVSATAESETASHVPETMPERQESQVADEKGQSPISAAAAAVDAVAETAFAGSADTPATSSNPAQSDASPAVSTPKPAVSEQQPAENQPAERLPLEQQESAKLAADEPNKDTDTHVPAVEHIPVEISPPSMEPSATAEQPELPATIEANIDEADKPVPAADSVSANDNQTTSH
ncbi:hypothetical protein IWW36_003712 [Coemansia brasiliensis]|uniref:Uncharacterized protein n=1 Tax=Coemansia brasiliensis TaxID=2650707 RepID=A0A9W8I788_9FUNG|nr:hypothetical protein IWW36_003712 [Coemansia brasiliensis]